MKKVTLSVDLTFNVPDETPISELFVEFPTSNPVVHSLRGGPIEGANFYGHETRHVSLDEDEEPVGLRPQGMNFGPDHVDLPGDYPPDEPDDVL